MNKYKAACVGHLPPAAKTLHASARGVAPLAGDAATL